MVLRFVRFLISVASTFRKIYVSFFTISKGTDLNTYREGERAMARVITDQVRFTSRSLKECVTKPFLSRNNRCRLYADSLGDSSSWKRMGVSRRASRVTSRRR